MPIFLNGHTDRVTHMCYKSSGTIETASLDGTVRIWMRQAAESEIEDITDAVATADHCTSSANADASSGNTEIGGESDIDSNVSSTVSPRYIMSKRSEETPDRNTFTCRAILKIFDNGGDDAFGIDLCSISSCVLSSTSCSIETGADNTTGHSKSNLDASIRGSVSAQTISEGVDDDKERETIVEIRYPSSGLKEDQMSPLGPAAATAAAAAAEEVVAGTSGLKSWVIAVSLGGTVRAYSTPTFVPVQLSDTQTF